MALKGKTCSPKCLYSQVAFKICTCLSPANEEGAKLSSLREDVRGRLLGKNATRELGDQLKELSEARTQREKKNGSKNSKKLKSNIEDREGQSLQKG